MGFFSFLFASLFVFLILEGFWGYWSIAFFQQVASLGNNIAIQIAAGSSLKVGQYRIPSDLYCASFPLIFFSIRSRFVVGWGNAGFLFSAGCLQALSQRGYADLAAFYYLLWSL